MHQLLASTLVAEGGGGGLTGILPFVLMIGVIYFIVLRPMSRQEKDRKKRVETLKKGDQVVLGGGILGRISNVDDEKIAVVEIADRVKIRVLKKDIVDTQANALEDKSKAGKDAKDKDAKDNAAKEKDKAAKDTSAKDKDAKDTSAKDKAKADEKDDDKPEKGAEAASS